MIFWLFSCPRFYAVILLAPWAALMPDLTYNYVQRNYFRSASDEALLVQKGYLVDGSLAPVKLRRVDKGRK